MLADFTVRVMIGSLVRVVGGWGGLGDLNLLWLMLCYMLPQFIFVVAGAKVAPRNQVKTAIALMSVGIAVSLMIHVIGQHLAGNEVGLVNYAHLTCQLSGLLGGLAYVVGRQGRIRRNATFSDGNDEV